MTDFQMFPLDYPGISKPGADFQVQADMAFAGPKYSGWSIERKVQEFYKAVLVGNSIIDPYATPEQRAESSVPVMTFKVKPDVVKPIQVLAGHLYGSPQIKGPRPAKVMVISKMPRPDDIQAPTYQHYDPAARIASTFVPAVLNPAAAAGAYFKRVCDAYRVDPSEWYVTNVFKGTHPDDPVNGSTLKVSWLNEWFPLLQQEIRIVQPDFILLLGVESAKALYGSKASIDGLDGRVDDYEYGVDPNDPTVTKTAKVLTTTNPSAVVRSSDSEPDNKFRATFNRLIKLLGGDQSVVTGEPGIDHRAIYSIAEWDALLNEIERDCVYNLIAVDAEWEGQHPNDPGAFLRTIQISWKHKGAAAIVLRNDQGQLNFTPEEYQYLRESFYRLLQSKVVAGHYVDSDFETLIYDGFIPSIWYVPSVPCSPEAYRTAVRAGTPCLFDTAIAAHACNETQDFSLNAQYLQHTEAPRYDLELLEWVTSFCKQQGIKKGQLRGYGYCPDDILLYYANYDADVTRRLAVHYIEQLDCDEFGHSSWAPFWVTMRQFNAFLEINSQGILVDPERINSLTELYGTKADELLDEIKDFFHWPTLNMNSVFQLREALYGDRYNGKSPPQKLRPAGAKTLGLTPIEATDGTRWEDVSGTSRELEVTASTNRRSLAILFLEKSIQRIEDSKGNILEIDHKDILQKIRDYRYLVQLGRYVLRRPKPDIPDEDVPDITEMTSNVGYSIAENIEDIGELTGDVMRYDGGIPMYISKTDGKIRTHMYATKETGRASSSRPSLQNISKRREDDYKRIIGKDRYIGPLRSLFRADPGHLLIAADFKGAELFACAVLSGDSVMLDHVTRNFLDENDPSYYDIHSRVAVDGLRLNCEPTKKGLESINRSHFRVVAKSLIFGLMYGRQAPAVANACREEGTNITVMEAEKMMNGIKATYPLAMDYLQRCAAAVTDRRYICGAFGRWRRCPQVSPKDRDIRGNFERQFMNFPMQNFVADAMARALDNLFWERCRVEVDYSLLLQIHDEILLQVPYEYVGLVHDVVLEDCMVKNVPIYPRDVYGNPVSRGPYRMGIDKSVMFRWGEKLKESQWKEIVKY